MVAKPKYKNKTLEPARTKPAISFNPMLAEVFIP